MTTQTTPAGTTPDDYAAVTNALSALADCYDNTGSPDAAQERIYALTPVAFTEYRQARVVASEGEVTNTERADRLRALVARRDAIHAGMVATPEERDAARADVCAAALSDFTAEDDEDGDVSAVFARMRELETERDALRAELAQVTTERDQEQNTRDTYAAEAEGLTTELAEARAELAQAKRTARFYAADLAARATSLAGSLA